MVILYDEPVPDFYPIAPFNLNGSPCVLALRLTLSSDGLPLSLSRSTEFHDAGEHSVQLLTFLKFLLTDEQVLNLGNWTWCKK